MSRPSIQTAPKTVFKIRLRVGDNVVVRAGKYKGKSGKVTAVHPTQNKVTVEGINVVKKHIKPNRQNSKGSTVELTKPIWVSKVGIVDPATKKPARIGYKVSKDGKKTRVYAQSTKEIK